MSYFDESQKMHLARAFWKAQFLAEVREHDRFADAIETWIHFCVETDAKKRYAMTVLQHVNDLNAAPKNLQKALVRDFERILNEVPIVEIELETEEESVETTETRRTGPRQWLKKLLAKISGKSRSPKGSSEAVSDSVRISLADGGSAVPAKPRVEAQAEITGSRWWRFLKFVLFGWTRSVLRWFTKDRRELSYAPPTDDEISQEEQVLLLKVAKFVWERTNNDELQRQIRAVETGMTFGNADFDALRKAMDSALPLSIDSWFEELDHRFMEIDRAPLCDTVEERRAVYNMFDRTQHELEQIHTAIEGSGVSKLIPSETSLLALMRAEEYISWLEQHARRVDDDVTEEVEAPDELGSARNEALSYLESLLPAEQKALETEVHAFAMAYLQKDIEAAQLAVKNLKERGEGMAACAPIRERIRHLREQFDEMPDLPRTRKNGIKIDNLLSAFASADAETNPEMLEGIERDIKKRLAEIRGLKNDNPVQTKALKKAKETTMSKASVFKSETETKLKAAQDAGLNEAQKEIAKKIRELVNEHEGESDPKRKEQIRGEVAEKFVALDAAATSVNAPDSPKVSSGIDIGKYLVRGAIVAGGLAVAAILLIGCLGTIGVGAWYWSGDDESPTPVANNAPETQDDGDDFADGFDNDPVDEPNEEPDVADSDTDSDAEPSDTLPTRDNAWYEDRNLTRPDLCAGLGNSENAHCPWTSAGDGYTFTDSTCSRSLGGVTATIYNCFEGGEDVVGCPDGANCLVWRHNGVQETIPVACIAREAMPYVAPSRAIDMDWASELTCPHVTIGQLAAN